MAAMSAAAGKRAVAAFSRLPTWHTECRAWPRPAKREFGQDRGADRGGRALIPRERRRSGFIISEI